MTPKQARQILRRQLVAAYRQGKGGLVLRLLARNPKDKGRVESFIARHTEIVGGKNNGK